ncbi:hypothetical protein FQN49_008630, partial [Arthroderma sp. PD_2]
GAAVGSLLNGVAAGGAAGSVAGGLTNGVTGPIGKRDNTVASADHIATGNVDRVMSGAGSTVGANLVGQTLDTAGKVVAPNGKREEGVTHVVDPVTGEVTSLVTGTAGQTVSGN